MNNKKLRASQNPSNFKGIPLSEMFSPKVVSVDAHIVTVTVVIIVIVGSVDSPLGLQFNRQAWGLFHLSVTQCYAPHICEKVAYMSGWCVCETF